MGLFKDIFGLSSINGSKEYRKRMLTGRDIVTGGSNYSVNTERRIKNLERLSSVERHHIARQSIMWCFFYLNICSIKLF